MNKCNYNLEFILKYFFIDFLSNNPKCTHINLFKMNHNKKLGFNKNKT